MRISRNNGRKARLTLTSAWVEWSCALLLAQAILFFSLSVYRWIQAVRCKKRRERERLVARAERYYCTIARIMIDARLPIGKICARYIVRRRRERERVLLMTLFGLCWRHYAVGLCAVRLVR